MPPQLIFDYDEADPDCESDAATFSIEVIRSERRKKTSQARLVGNKLVVRIPGRLTVAQEQEMVAHFSDLFKRRALASEVNLEERAEVLASKFGLPAPTSVKWVSNQRDRWGSCTPARGTIRLSDRMSHFPQWVIDYVLVHELAHLKVAGHDSEFWLLVNQYPLTERARGFLIAQSTMAT